MGEEKKYPEKNPRSQIEIDWNWQPTEDLGAEDWALVTEEEGTVDNNSLNLKFACPTDLNINAASYH